MMYNVIYHIQSDDDSDTSCFTENTERILQKNIINGGVFSETESDDDIPRGGILSMGKQVKINLINRIAINQLRKLSVFICLNILRRHSPKIVYLI